MQNDSRATEIGKYLCSGKMSKDAVRIIAYLVQKEETKGELEYFVSEEIDALR